MACKILTDIFIAISSVVNCFGATFLLEENDVRVGEASERF